MRFANTRSVYSDRGPAAAAWRMLINLGALLFDLVDSNIFSSIDFLEFRSCNFSLRVLLYGQEVNFSRPVRAHIDPKEEKEN